MSSLLAQSQTYRRPQYPIESAPEIEGFSPEQLYELGIANPTEAGITEAPITANVEGISISINDYYAGLHSLIKVGHDINRNSNFINQTKDPESPSYWAINNRFRLSGKDLTGAIEQARIKKIHLANLAIAGLKFDLFPPVDPELMNEEQTSRLSQEVFREFEAQYLGPNNKEALSALQKHVDKRLKKLGQQQNAA